MIVTVFSGTLVTQEDVMTLLRPFCADLEIPVQPRLDILQHLEEASSRFYMQNPFFESPYAGAKCGIEMDFQLI